MSTLLMWSPKLRGYSMISSSEKNLQSTCLWTNATKQARAMESRMGHNKDWSLYTSFSALRELASMNLSLHFHALSTAPMKSYHFYVNPPQAPCLMLWQNPIARFATTTSPSISISPFLNKLTSYLNTDSRLAPMSSLCIIPRLQNPKSASQF